MPPFTRACLFEEPIPGRRQIKLPGMPDRRPKIVGLCNGSCMIPFHLIYGCAVSGVELAVKLIRPGRKREELAAF